MSEDRANDLPALAIRRPWLVIVINLLIVIAGVGAWLGVEVRELPNIDRPIVAVRADYPGAAPETLDAEVTRILEGAAARVPGVYLVRSASEEGNLRVIIEFNPNVDLVDAANDVRDAVARVQGTLPEGVENLTIVKADADADERIVLAEYRNPFQTVLAGFADSLQAYRSNQSTKPPLGYEYILRARNFLVPNGEQSLQTRPSLTDLPHLRDFFATRADWIYVDESLIDRDDPNCIWREVKADRKMKDKREVVDSYQIWSPVRFVALYTLLRFPLRGQQILWLDSGEADDEIAVLDAEHGGVRWEKNTSPMA